MDEVLPLFDSESETQETHMSVNLVNSTLPKSVLSQWPDPLKDLFEKSISKLNDSD